MFINVENEVNKLRERHGFFHVFILYKSAESVLCIAHKKTKKSTANWQGCISRCSVIACKAGDGEVSGQCILVRYGLVGAVCQRGVVAKVPVVEEWHEALCVARKDVCDVWHCFKAYTYCCLVCPISLIANASFE